MTGLLTVRKTSGKTSNICMKNLNRNCHCIFMWACCLQPTVYMHPIKEIPLRYRSNDWEPMWPKTLSVVAGRGEEKEWRKRGRKDGNLVCLERIQGLCTNTRYHYWRPISFGRDTSADWSTTHAEWIARNKNIWLYHLNIMLYCGFWHRENGQANTNFSENAVPTFVWH
jgi:hypothetical protein